jgi:hypothetical protein
MNDPFAIVLGQQRAAIREKHGCSACAMRGREILGKHLCRIDLEPGKRGFCMQWKLDETFSG